MFHSTKRNRVRPLSPQKNDQISPSTYVLISAIHILYALSLSIHPISAKKIIQKHNAISPIPFTFPARVKSSVISSTPTPSKNSQPHFFNYYNCMKNAKGVEPSRSREDDRMRKTNSIQRHTFSPINRAAQTRLVEYEHLARKAKQQLKQLQVRRKNSPEIAKYRLLTEQTDPRRQVEFPNRLSAKYSDGNKNLPNSYSQKYFKKENANKQPNIDIKDVKVRSTHKEANGMDKPSPEPKVGSPKKKQFMDSNEYKKLHEKLDSIEHKITDMKKNLQKKKEEKQKILEIKNKSPREQNQKKISLKGLVTQVPEHAELKTFNSNPYSPRHNVYYVSELVRAFMDQKSLAREHLNTSLSILKMLEKSKKLTDEECKKMRINLPRRKGYQNKKTVVFDLDQTLIHCNDTPNPPYSVKLPIKFPTGEIIQAGINIRPYAKEILKNLSKYFEVIVFTASHSCYANVVVDYLDPDRQWVHHRLFRQHCFLSGEGLYVKDLRMINRDLSEMVLIDNAAYSYAYQLENGIPIFPYYHGQIDFQLKALEEYLMKMLVVKDMRELNDRTFRLNQYKYYYNKPQKLVQQLYIPK